MTDGYEQYYVEEEPRATWQTVAIIVGAVIVGVVIIVAAVALVRGWRNNVQEKTSTEAIVTETEQVLNGELVKCEDELDPEACRANLIQDEAVETGYLAICEMLEDDDYDDCIKGLARERESLDLCDSIKDGETKEACQSELLLKEAREAQDYGLCDQIPSESWRVSCQNQLKSVVIGQGECVQYGLDESLCNTDDAVWQAAAAQDLDFCYTLTELQGFCLDLINYSDEDKDGLNLEEEILVYGSDPDNSDTDGDGYSDGAEVGAGYSPVGEGVLEL